MKKNVKLIGLTGTNGAGKGEVAAFFKKRGYTYYSLSDLIREELRQKNLEITRDNLIKMGNKMRENFGSDILARKVIKKINGKAIIDSIRNPSEVKFLKAQENFILISVDAPVELRYKRTMKRGRNESALSLNEFIKKEKEENTNNHNKQQLQECMKMANLSIYNKNSIEALQKKLEVFFGKEKNFQG
ncbi:MAG: AAA family ATPase [Candidatus Aminicenantaceae bacterium]